MRLNIDIFEKKLYIYVVDNQNISKQMNFFFGILPVLLFLVFLFLLDSFKLVITKLLLLSILWGAAVAVITYFINSNIMEAPIVEYKEFSRYIAPLIEESIKSIFIFVLIFQKRIGFFIDAAIYGFAIGTGFALVENLFFLQGVNEVHFIASIIRGFGTAIMHGGCTALIAIVLVGAKSVNSSFWKSSIVAILSAYILHSAYNHFYINPLLQTIGIIIIIPAIFILLFKQSEIRLQNWLEIEFSTEIELLQMIKKGNFSQTKAGEYLASLKSRFSSEIIFDMYCYIQLYLELSVKAKRNLMLKESGIPPIPEDDIQLKLVELNALKKQIGKVGEITLAPLIKMNYRDLWKLNLLK